MKELNKVKIDFLDVLCVAAGVDTLEERGLVVIRNTKLDYIENGNVDEINFEYLEGCQANKLTEELYDKEEIFKEAYLYGNRVMCKFKNGERIFLETI